MLEVIPSHYESGLGILSFRIKRLFVGSLSTLNSDEEYQSQQKWKRMIREHTESDSSNLKVIMNDVSTFAFQSQEILSFSNLKQLVPICIFFVLYIKANWLKTQVYKMLEQILWLLKLR